MPRVVCDIHGKNFAPHGCRHVAEHVWAKQYPGHATHVDLDGFFMKGWVCDACLNNLNEHGLQKYLERHKGYPEYPPEGELDPLLDIIDFQPMCLKCFQAFLEGKDPSAETTLA